MRLTAYGRTIELHGPDHVLAQVLTRLPPSYQTAQTSPERVWRLAKQDGLWLATADGELVAGHSEPSVAAERLLGDVELWVAAHAVDRIFIHAGCVVWQDRAIILPGRSMSGKSSLTAALVRVGAEYFSDEYAVLDGSGLVEPYARPLSLRPYDGGPPQRVPVEELGGRVGSGPRQVGLVAALRYMRGDYCVTSVSPGEGVLSLLDNAVPAQRRAAEALQAAAASVQRALLISGDRNDADEAAARMLSLMERA